jgi:hypothetical protein
MSDSLLSIRIGAFPTLSVFGVLRVLPELARGVGWGIPSLHPGKRGKPMEMTGFLKKFQRHMNPHACADSKLNEVRTPHPLQPSKSQPFE